MANYPYGLNDIGLYLRKSRADLEAEARGEGETLAKHRRALLEIAKKYNYTITDVFEEIVSGERIVDRQEMQKLLHNVRDGKYSAVLCMDIDRLGRGNMIDQGMIQEAFKASDTLIITPRKVYDLRDEMDEEWSEFESFMGRRELKIITRRLQRGRQASAKEGRWLAKKAPYGYLKDENKILYPDPETADIVSLIYDWHGQGKGIVWIASELRNIGAKPPENDKGPSKWNHATVNDILKNEAYLGRVIWGRYRHHKEHGRVRKEELPREEWTVVENAHQALITQAQWELSQRMRHIRQPRVPSNYDIKNPLAGLVRCGTCGRLMQHRIGHYGRKARICCHDSYCATGSATFEDVENAILEQLTAIASTAPHIDVETERDQEQSAELVMRKIRNIDQEIEKKNTQQANLHTFLEQGVYTVDVFLERSRIIGEEKKQLESDLASAQSELQTLEASTSKQNNILPAVANAVKEYRNCETVMEKNLLLKSIVEQIVFHKDKTTKLFAPFELDIYLRD